MWRHSATLMRRFLSALRLGFLRRVLGRPCVIFLFADTPGGAYRFAYPLLGRRGWAGMIMTVTTSVDVLPAALTGVQLTELDAAGWDIASHGYKHEDPTLMDPTELDDHLRLSQHWLLERGYARGARHYGPPYNCNEAVQEAALGYYDTVITPRLEWAVLPGDAAYGWLSPHDAIPWSRVQRTLSSLDRGAVLILGFHDVVSSDPKGLQTSVTRLKRVINCVRAHGIGVATMSQLLDVYRIWRGS